MNIEKQGTFQDFLIQTDDKKFEIQVSVVDNKTLTIRTIDTELNFCFLDSDPITVRRIGEMLIVASGLIKESGEK